MFKRFINFYSPDDSETIEDKAVDTFDLLNTDEDEIETLDIKDKKEDKEDELPESDSKELDTDTEDEDKKSEEKDELDEIEEELENEKEIDEDELELVTPVRRAEILKEFPDLFKKFPYLEKAYYREQKYTEILPTIKDAEIAAESKRLWENLEGELSNGDLTNLLKTVHEADKNSFYKIADNFLDIVEQVDPKAAEHIYTGVVKQAIEMLYNNEETKDAAAKAYKFFFPGKGWEDHKPLAQETKEDPRASQLNKDRQDFLKQQYMTAREDVVTRAENVIKATIERNIDPKNSMIPYVKTNAIRDTMTIIKEQMASDTRFQKILTKLWQDSANKNFNQDSKNRIRSAVLTKAKQLLAPAIKKSRQTALAGSVKKESKTQTARNPGQKTTTPSNSGKQQIDKEKLRGMSTLDILNS